MSTRVPVWLVLFGAGAALASACVGDDSPDVEVPSLEPTDCSKPRPGCACQEEGAAVACGASVGATAAGTVCGRGTAICSDGSWSDCAIDSQVTLQPGADPQTQGGAVGCADPCDIYCQTFNDDPTGEDDPGSGIVVDGGGITLPGGTSPPIPSNCSGGTSGTCAHTICEPGVALTADCDAAPGAPMAGPPTSEVAFSESFNNNSAGWTLDNEWEIGSASSSSGHQYGFADPNSDTTSGGNNGVAGVDIGGNVNLSAHGMRYLTSPTIDTSKYNASLTLSFERWLNSDFPPYMENQIQVFDGSSWVTVWSGAPTDSSWQTPSYDVTAYANAAFRVRFGFSVGNLAYATSGWNIDDVSIVGEFTATTTTSPGGSCVSTVCALDPACCSGAWTVSCVQKVLTECNVACNCTSTGEFLPCYADIYDHDGDGYTGLDGDCLDCDPSINAGSYDFLDTIDNDCDGTIDNEVETCDNGLALSTTDAVDHARAIDLCRTTTKTATGASKTWGVIASDSRVSQADPSLSPHIRSHGLMSQFGNAQNAPFKGARLAVYSSGTARTPGQPQYVNPNGQISSYVQGTSCSYPAGFPANATGCPVAVGTANDSTGLYLSIRVPSNAQSFSYNFRYFSSEYPEWLCTIYNDHFVGLLDATATQGNISFDSLNNPVSVNVGFFNEPGCPTCTSNVLTNTGFDGACWGDSCGGATDWLVTSAPVEPGEDITMQFAVWDQGDFVWDSTVIVDNWTWSAQPALVSTQPVVPPTGPSFTDGYFVRDYDASGVCPQGTSIRWTDWSWTTSTPTDSYVAFSVKTASSASGLDSAPEDALLFTNPPGPSQKTGDPAVAEDGNPVDTQVGALVVDSTLKANNRATNQPFLRVISHLAPSSDAAFAPTLLAWNQQFECIPSQ
jgi:hypothetical protein